VYPETKRQMNEQNPDRPTSDKLTTKFQVEISLETRRQNTDKRICICMDGVLVLLQLLC